VSCHRLHYGAHFVVLATPIFDLLHGVVHIHEPVLSEAFEPGRGVEALDIGVVGWLSWPGEVKRDAVRVGPEIKFFRGELAALIDADRVWLGQSDVVLLPKHQRRPSPSQIDKPASPD